MNKFQVSKLDGAPVPGGFTGVVNIFDEDKVEERTISWVMKKTNLSR